MSEIKIYSDFILNETLKLIKDSFDNIKETSGVS